MKSMKKLVLAGGSALSALMMAAGKVSADVVVSDVTPGKGYATDFGVLFNSILNVVMLIAALLVFGFLIMGGIEWITSGGDKGKAESARNKLTSAVIGLIVIAASYAIITLVLQFLGFGGLNDVFDSVGTINSAR